jgi:hypothetical protein
MEIQPDHLPLKVPRNVHQKAFFNLLLKQLQKQPRNFFIVLDKLEELKAKDPKEFYNQYYSDVGMLFLAERPHLEILGACLDIEGPIAESSNWLEKFANCPSVIVFFEKFSSSQLDWKLTRFVRFLQNAFPHLGESWQTLWHSLPIDPQTGAISTSPTIAPTTILDVDVPGCKNTDKKDSSELENPTLEAEVKEISASLQVTNVESPTQTLSPIFSSITSGLGKNRARYTSTASSGVYLLDVQLTHRSQLARLGRKECWRGAQTRAQIWISRYGPTSSIYEKMMNLREELDRFASEHMKIQWSNRTEKRKRSDSDTDSQKE